LAQAGDDAERERLLAGLGKALNPSN